MEHTHTAPLSIASSTPLAGLLGPDAAAEFLARRWPGEPFAVHRDLGDLPEVLRSPVILEPRNLTRVYRGKVEVTNGPSAQHEVSGADAAVFFERLGLAVRFAGLEPYLPGTPAWLRGLERELGIPEGAAGLHAFINAEGIGLPAHCDPYEHIAIQLAGTKSFRYRRNPYTRYMSASHSCSLDPSRHAAVQSDGGLPGWARLPHDRTEVTMRPGSVLFLPRGVYHETSGGSGGRSVTLVIQLRVPSRAELLLGYLRDYLAQDEAWRTPVVGAWPDAHPQRDAALRDLGGLLARLGATVGALSTEHLVRAREGGAASQSFAWGARLICNPAVQVDIATDGDSVAIEVRPADPLAPAQCIELAGDAADVFAWILARPGLFEFGDVVRRFDDWDDESLATMVRFLVANRAVVVVPVEPFAG